VLDHVEARRVLEQPARKDAAPFRLRIGVGALEYVDLDESPRLGRLFPWRGALASGQTDHDIADAAGFAGRHFQIAADVVALVEQAEHSHALFHRRADAAVRYRRRTRAGELLGNFGCFGFGLGRFAGARREQRDQQQDRESAARFHASGVHAS